MRLLLMVFVLSAPVQAQDFATKEGCMSMLSREVSAADTLSGMDRFWESRLSSSPEEGRTHADRIVELKGQISDLQADLADEMLSLCASYPGD